jgi:hypothetical protein
MQHFQQRDTPGDVLHRHDSPNLFGAFPLLSGAVYAIGLSIPQRKGYTLSSEKAKEESLHAIHHIAHRLHAYHCIPKAVEA